MSPSVEYGEHVTAVAEEIDALAEAIGAGPASSPVPTCPGWAVSDLALHVGQFCGFWTHVLCEGTGRPKTPFPEQPGDDPTRWIATLGGYLVGELSATPSRTEVWTWYDADNSAAFVARRCAHELAVHRYDAQSARGRCRPIAPALAADGIDEVLTTLVEARPRTGEATGQVLRMAATDVDIGWIVTLEPDRILVTDSTDDAPRDRGRAGRSGGAGLTLRGGASDLELALYGRPTLGTVERLGDDAVLEAWRREFLF